MATLPPNGSAQTPPTPRRPGLSFIVYHRVPHGCFAYLVERDECSPHVRPGETVIVDPQVDNYESGELYLIEWLSETGRRQLAKVSPVPDWMTILGKEGEPDPSPHYFIAGIKPQQPLSLSGKPLGAPILFHDGPYATGEIAKRVKGRVAGVLHSSFEEPKRPVGTVRP